MKFSIPDGDLDIFNLWALRASVSQKGSLNSHLNKEQGDPFRRNSAEAGDQGSKAQTTPKRIGLDLEVKADVNESALDFCMAVS